MSSTNQNQEINIKYKSWVYIEKIPSEICDIIVNDFKDREYNYGMIGIGTNYVNKKHRFVKTIPVPEDHWSLGILCYFGFDSNIVNFKYNITHLKFTNFLTYQTGMFYSPHNDVSPDTNDSTHQRKLTVILQLSDDSDYKGGNIILYHDLKPYIMPRKKGSIIVFDSSATHCVSKITEGTRHSLCGWICGEPFA
jgi:PKHD-type hydroxylase